jgi:hypothetical protein
VEGEKCISLHFAGNPEERDLFIDLDVDGRIILKSVWKKYSMGCELY